MLALAGNPSEGERSPKDRERRDWLKLVTLLIRSATAIVLDLISRGHLSL